MKIFGKRGSFRFLDGLAVVLSLTAALSLFLFNLYHYDEGGYVRILTENKELVYSLDEDRSITPLEATGTCTIAIDSGQVFVESSNCPLQICVQTGKISRAGEWIACLPHQVFIEISGQPSESEIDSHSY